MSREEIDAAIARHADQELLFDQPYENSKAIRVAGPFTVESLSPHRMLDQPRCGHRKRRPSRIGTAPLRQRSSRTCSRPGSRTGAGPSTSISRRLEPYAGRWVHMRGEFSDKEGATRRVAVSLGPEHGTVGADQVNEAAKEAMKGAGSTFCSSAPSHSTRMPARRRRSSRLPTRCGWAVAAEERKLGKLPVMLVRMNPDLVMGDELLKKTGSGNLFMVFGEPDIAIERGRGRSSRSRSAASTSTTRPRATSARTRPTTSPAGSSTPNYNGESFFVRHAYFTGADDPYKRLQPALKADIDEDAWATLYRTAVPPVRPPRRPARSPSR